MRSGILQQLKDLKVLTEDSVLTDVEYVAQKQKLLQELQDLKNNLLNTLRVGIKCLNRYRYSACWM